MEQLDWVPFTSDVIEELQSGDRTGYSVDIVPDFDVNNATVAVGRPYYSNTTSGQANVGAVSIYTYDSTNREWNLKGEHIIGNVTNGRLGSSVCMNKDATCFAVGAPGESNNTGAVYAYNFVNGSWMAAPGLNGANEGDLFGSVVSGNRSANEALISAPYETYNNITNCGTVRHYEFDKNTMTWTLSLPILSGIEENEHFGTSLQGSNNDRKCIVGSPDALNGMGRIYHFNQDSNQDYIENGTISGGQLGSAVSISFSGNQFAVTENSTVCVYKKQGQTYVKQPNGNPVQLTGLQSGDGFGASHQIVDDADGNFHVTVGAPFYNSPTMNNIGYIQQFFYNTTSGNVTQYGSTIYGEQAGQQFGSSVSSNLTGSIIGAGAPTNSYAQFYYFGIPIDDGEFIPCFHPSTPITTTNGIKQIQVIQKDDIIVSYDGSTALIEEIKCFRSHIKPYRIAKYAIKRGVPSEDIILSPDHMLKEPRMYRKGYRPTKKDEMRGWKKIQDSSYAQQDTHHQHQTLFTYYHIRTSTRKPIRVANIIMETLGGIKC